MAKLIRPLDVRYRGHELTLIPQWDSDGSLFYLEVWAGEVEISELLEGRHYENLTEIFMEAQREF